VLEPQLADQRQCALPHRNSRERAARAAASDVVSQDGLQAGPVVVCFDRGGRYPYCNLELPTYHAEPQGAQ
jgi:hypothetical protein